MTDLARPGAALVASSVGLHLLMLHHLALVPAVLMLAMSAVCAGCALTLARGGSPRAWATVLVMSGLMLVVHHAGAMHDMVGHGATLSLLATMVAAAEVGLAALALVVGPARRVAG